MRSYGYMCCKIGHFYANEPHCKNMSSSQTSALIATFIRGVTTGSNHPQLPANCPLLWSLSWLKWTLKFNEEDSPCVTSPLHISCFRAFTLSSRSLSTSLTFAVLFSAALSCFQDNCSQMQHEDKLYSFAKLYWCVCSVISFAQFMNWT